MIDTIIEGEALEVMDTLIDQGITVDACITDPPYGTTACAWDSVIPFNNHIMIPKGKKQIPMYEDEWVLHEATHSHKSIHYCIDEFKERSKEG